MFWKACGRKKCLRARACVVDSRACFDRLWPIVPEKMKVIIRSTVKAAEARLSPAETAAAIERELARWRATMAPREVPQAAAEPAPQSPPIMRAAPNPRASSPRASRSPGARAMMTTMRYAFAIPFLVITGHSRSKNGVASLAYVPVIPLRGA